jgi:uncharacterized protein YjbI with pentapeptide repeats
MEEKLRQFLDKTFAPYGNFPSRVDVTKELLANLLEKYQNLKEDGMSDEQAYQTTVDSFGDVEEIMEQLPHGKKQQEAAPEPGLSLRQTLKKTFRQAKAMMGISKFGAVALQQADLSDSNLAGENFSYSALTETVFDRSDLRKATFSAAALTGASFAGANVSGATFAASALQNATFIGADLTGTKFQASALKGATFKDTTLVNTDFHYSDLGGVSFDGKLDGVMFNGASLKETSFQNATLREVSFHHAEVKYAIFDGAKMDKITYALLKSAGAVLDNAKVI